MTPDFLIHLFAKCYFWVYLIGAILMLIDSASEDSKRKRENAIKYGRTRSLNPCYLTVFFMCAYIYLYYYG